MRITSSLLAVACGFVLMLSSRTAAVEKLGVFESSGDIGTVLHAGSAKFDSGSNAYTVSGSGENMWFTADAFQFVWRRVPAGETDLTLTADVAFEGAGKNPHRKAVLMVRQSLDADSAYADVALHGDGLTSLQYRDGKGERTHEVQSNRKAPRRLQLEKRGAYVSLALAGEDGQLLPAGAAMRVDLREPFYVGVGVC